MFKITTRILEQSRSKNQMNQEVEVHQPQCKDQLGVRIADFTHASKESLRSQGSIAACTSTLPGHIYILFNFLGGLHGKPLAYATLVEQSNCAGYAEETTYARLCKLRRAGQRLHYTDTSQLSGHCFSYRPS